MPPGALRRYLQFPEMPQEQQAQVGQARGPVQTVNVTAPKYGGIDDDIEQQIQALKSLQANRPQMNLGAAPGRSMLPQRPQASAWEAIPQIFAGAGNVLSAGSNHPQDYLTPLMNRQQGARDQAYGDAMAQHQNMFQNEREAYSDKLMRYAMQLREHEGKERDSHSLLQTLMEQKYLTGQKTPQDMQDTQKRETYRAMFDKFDMLKEAEDHARELKATRPEDAKLIDEVLNNKKAAVSGRGQGMVEYMTNTPAGRGMFEAPQGPVRQPDGNPAFDKVISGERTADERLGSLKQALTDPKFYENRADKKLTKQQYVERVQKAIEKLEAEKKSGGSSEPDSKTLPFKTSIGKRLQEEMQSKDGGTGRKLLEEWAKQQRVQKD